MYNVTCITKVLHFCLLFLDKNLNEQDRHTPDKRRHIPVSKKIHDFNDIIRKLRKKIFGKGPERIHTVFVQNMAISTLYGNLTPAEQFIARTTEGKETVHRARTKLIQNLYASSLPEGLEDLLGVKLNYLFSDIKVEEDIAVSVFLFEANIQ